MPQRLWDSPSNPPRWVSGRLGILQWGLSDALHKIKKAAGSRGADRITIMSDGTVTDDRGEAIWNVYDEIRQAAEDLGDAAV
jgi:hypothetical protein